MHRTSPRVVAAMLVCLLTAWSASAAYRVRFSRDMDEGCDFRGGWYVDVIGERLFAGGPWDQFDCGVYGYGLLVWDVTTGVFERELLGTDSVAATSTHLLLGHVDGVQVADPDTFAVARTLVGPNAEDPWLVLRGAVGDDALAVGAGDTPEAADTQVVYRLATDDGAVVQRYVAPQPAGAHLTVHAAVGGGVVAVGTFSNPFFDGSPYGVFVFGADDGALRWSASTPAGGYSSRVGHSVAVSHQHVFVGVPGFAPQQPDGQVLVFDVATGALLHTLEAPIPVAGNDGFGRAVAVSDGGLLVGAHGIGDEPLPGRAFLFSTSDWSLLETLSAESEIPMGDAVAFGDDELVAGGNEFDGVVHVFEPDTGSTTTTTLPSCPGGCDDGDACTVDACVGGQCQSTSGPGLDGTRCRLDQLRAALDCAPPPRAHRLDVRLQRMLGLIDVVDGGDPAQQLPLLRRLMLRFRTYCRRVERMDANGRLEPSCAVALSMGCPSHIYPGV